jgi:hypothetical protein
MNALGSDQHTVLGRPGIGSEKTGAVSRNSARRRRRGSAAI